MSVPPPPTIQVQVVLRHTPLFSVWRLVRGLVQTHRLAADKGMAGGLVLRFADRSSQPGLQAAELEGLRTLTDATGVEFADPIHRPGGELTALHSELSAAATAEVSWLFWLDADAYPGPRCLTELLAATQGVQTAGAEARMVPFDDRKTIEADAGTTPWFSPTATLLRRAAFDGVGGFADGLPDDGAIIDLSWRLRAAGWRLAYAPEAAVFVDRPVQLDDDAGTGPSPLARLVLAHRFLDQTSARRLHKAFAASASVAEREAAATVTAASAAGTLPASVANASGIAALTPTGQLVSRY